jgi:hypothetical protein
MVVAVIHMAMSLIVTVPREPLDVIVKRYYLQIHVLHGLAIRIVHVFLPMILFDVYVHLIEQEDYVSSTLILTHVLRRHVLMMLIALA